MSVFVCVWLLAFLSVCNWWLYVCDRISCVFVCARECGVMLLCVGCACVCLCVFVCLCDVVCLCVCLFVVIACLV